MDLEDKDAIAVVDAGALKVKATYDISARGGGPAGLGLDDKNHVLFSTCHTPGKDAPQGSPATMVILTTDGKILDALPIGNGTDGGGFNPNTMEAFSSNGQAGTLSVIKEESPTKFAVEQSLATVQGGNFKTMTIDTKTNNVLLIGAEYQAATPPPDAPPPPAGRAGRAGRAMVADSFTILVAGK